MHLPTLPTLVADPSWFPARFDFAHEAFGFRRVDPQTIADAGFLDQRAWANDAPLLHVPWRQLPPPAAATAPLAWVFHTGFCGSTLLARILQDPPRVMALREPQALLDLAQASHRLPIRSTDAALARLLVLLARPWRDGGQCLVKPTNHANNLLPQLLRASSGRAILLYSSLPEFVLSRCSKLPTAERFVRWLAQHLLRGSRLADALGVPWNHEFHFIEACVLAWHVQIEIFADALAADTDDRLRSLDFETLRAAPEQAVPACARWLDLGADDAFWQQRAAFESGRDAKHVDRQFNARDRAAQRQVLRQRHRPLLDAARQWSEQVVAPVAVMPAHWKPLLPASS